MNSRYKSKQFKELQDFWYKRLAEEGFIDLEDKHQDLYQHDIRTISWRNKDRLEILYSALDEYLAKNDNISDRDRKVLELWTAGMYQVKIAEIMQVSLITVKRTIRKYKMILFPHI